jgi:hypothetical protein
VLSNLIVTLLGFFMLFMHTARVHVHDSSKYMEENQQMFSRTHYYIEYFCYWRTHIIIILTGYMTLLRAVELRFVLDAF